MPPLGTTAGPFKFLPFVGGAISTGAGFAVGAATAPTLRPVLQDLENLTWAAHASRPLDAEVAAGIVAENVEQRDWGANEAIQGGIDGERFNALLGEALNAPGLGPLFELWRRNLISDGDFTHGLRKAKLEGRWDGPLEGLRETLLSSEELAMLQQQGFVGSDRANSEGALQGVTNERQQLRFEASGLPPGIETALQMLRRGIITDAQFAQIVREGHTKTKYTDELLELRHPVLSAPEYATLHLKGWISESEMNAGGSLTGFTTEQMNLLYLGRGRPAAPGQMATAAARGIDGPKGRPVDREQFIDAIKQSDIRPEYGPMLWDARFLYPPLFQLTRLVQAEAIDADTAREWAVKDRYPPEVVNALHAYWTKAPAGATDTHLAKAQTQLWTTTHRSYIAAESDDVTATEKLTEAGVSAATIPQVLGLWAHERELVRKQLSPAQIKKAMSKAVPNEATGLPWSYDDALAALISRGWAHADASTFLKT